MLRPQDGHGASNQHAQPGDRGDRAPACTFREQHGRYRRALDVLYQVSVASRGRASFRAIFEITYQELRAVFAGEQAEYIEQMPHGDLTGRLLANRTPLLFSDLATERLQSPIPSDRFGNSNKLSRVVV